MRHLRLCDVENAAIVATDPNINFSSVVTPRADPKVVSDYADHWWAHDPTAAVAAKMPAGQVTSLEDTGRQKFFSSPFFNDYWRHSGLGAERIATNLFTDDGGFASFILQASTGRDEIGTDARQRFLILIPHLIRAVDVARTLQRMAFEKSLLSSGYGAHQTGAVIVDTGKRVLFADDTADSLFKTHSGVAVVKGARSC